MHDSKLYARLTSALLLPYGMDASMSDNGGCSSSNGAGTSSNVSPSSRGKGGKGRSPKNKDKGKAAAGAEVEAESGKEREPPKEMVKLSGMPLERRALLELGALGILREGDNAGDWTTFCREMRRTSVDSQIDVELRAREQREEALDMELQGKIGKLRKAYVEELENSVKEEDAGDRVIVANFRRRFGGTPEPIPVNNKKKK